MTIPRFDELMLPLLHLMSDGEEHFRRNIVETLAGQFQLTDDECKEILPSGQQTVFDNRVGWATTYLAKAYLLESPRRGVTRITPRGKDILNETPLAIDVRFLRQRSPEFVEWQSKHSANSRNNERVTPPDHSITTAEQTPEEALGTAYVNLRNTLADDLLERVCKCDPDFFEKLVIELLVKMGYGGTLQDAGTRVGKSGDGGIDGIIKEDRLGLDIIYIQAKRWQGVVGRPEIQKFVGALQGQRARKGVFITTSSYTNDAIKYASQIDTKVILIDGEYLANLMIDFDIGVSTVSSYNIKRVDSDYFEES